MPVFGLQVSLSLLLCLLVVDPVLAKITIKLQMMNSTHFAEASLQLSEILRLWKCHKTGIRLCVFFLPTVKKIIFGVSLTRV